MTMLIFVAAVIFSISCQANAGLKEDTIDLMQWVACAKSEEPRYDYVKCTQLRPPEMSKIAFDCIREILPASSSIDDLFPRICRNERLAGKLFDCAVRREIDARFTEDDKSMMREFLRCANEVNNTFCYKED